MRKADSIFTSPQHFTDRQEHEPGARSLLSHEREVALRRAPNAEASQIVTFLAPEIPKLRNVDAIRPAKIRHAGFVRFERRDETFEPYKGVIHEEVAQGPGGIGQPVGILGRCRVEEQASRLDGRRAQNDYAAFHFVFFTRHPIDERDASGFAGFR
jgi:hypothetical protein